MGSELNTEVNVMAGNKFNIQLGACSETELVCKLFINGKVTLGKKGSSDLIILGVGNNERCEYEVKISGTMFFVNEPLTVLDDFKVKSELNDLDLSPLRDTDEENELYNINNQIEQTNSCGIQKGLGRKTRQSSKKLDLFMRAKNSQLEGPYFCVMCGFSTLNKTELCSHITQHSKRKYIKHRKSFTREKRICKCVFCSFSTKKATLLVEHLEKSHVFEQVFACQLCDFNFDTKENLDSHIKSMHFNSGVPECPTCKLACDSLGSLLEHDKKLHVPSRTTNTCVLCFLSFPSKGLLKEHTIERHTKGEKPALKCGICGLVPDKYSRLVQHFQARHTNLRPHLCPQCGKSFKCRTSFLAHSYSHREDRPYTCKDCLATFKSPGGLATHKLRSHGNAFKPQVCGICGAVLKRKAYLYEHIKRKHSEVRPFSCDICDRKFKTADCLKKHMIRHSDVKKFSCNLCSYKAKTNKEVNRHIRRKHKELNFICNLCGFRCAFQFDLTLHMNSKHYKITKAKTHKCPECDYVTNNPYSLKGHRKSVHSDERPFICSQCGMSFKQNRHLVVHTYRKHSDEKPFACDICDYRGKHRAALREHMKTHYEEKGHKCALCSYACRRMNALRRHMYRVHKMGMRDLAAGKKPIDIVRTEQSDRHDQAIVTSQTLHLMTGQGGHAMYTPEWIPVPTNSLPPPIVFHMPQQ